METKSNILGETINIEKMIRYVFVFAMMLFGIQAYSQLTVGFKAGLTYSTLKGPSEMFEGESLETKKLSSGFHVGATFNYKITDIFGMRAGLIFNQKGGKYTYNGPSNFYFRNEPPEEDVWIEGNRNMTYKMTNAFIDVPLTLYVKAGRFEIHGGAYASVLAAGSAGGELIFNGSSLQTGNAVEEFRATLDHNYYRNEARGASGFPQEVIVDGEQQITPTIQGAYYEYEEKDGSFLKPFDFGLTGTINYFINEGFYVGVDFQYGLADMTNNKMDISYSILNNDLTRPTRDDKDTNIGFNVSLGFSF